MKYIAVSEAIPARGLRLVLSAGAPGPWGEAAKALFDIKGISYTPVEQHVGTKDKNLFDWTGQYAAPAAMWDDERPRTRWYEILALAERLTPTPCLTPPIWPEKVKAFGLTHAICGEDGLGWLFRQCVLEAQTKAVGAPQTGYNDSLNTLRSRYMESFDADDAMKNIVAILNVLATQLTESQSLGGKYFLGDQLSVVDIYWVTFSNWFAPINDMHCPMPQTYRDLGLWMNSLVGQALDPSLIEHRDRVLREHFKLPMWF